MNTLIKMQVIAGFTAVIALPIMYLGLHNGSTVLPWLGIALFLLAMLVTPAVRILPSHLITEKDYSDV